MDYFVIFIIIALSACVIGLVISSYFLIRNEFVCRFRIKVSQLCYKYEIAKIRGHIPIDNFDAQIWFRDRFVSYDQMLYSTKTLSISKWVPIEILEKFSLIEKLK